MKVVLGVIAGIVAIAALIIGSWAFKYYTAEIRGTVEAEQRIESASSRIGNYNYFFDMCTSVQAQKGALQAQKNRLEYTTDQGELSRVRTNIAAIESNIVNSVSRYNNDARKDYTAGRFLASNLPYQLSTQGVTVCAQ